MRLVIDNTTRFFAVVGAPYIAERHVDSESEGRGPQRNAYEGAIFSPSVSTGSWLNDAR